MEILNALAVLFEATGNNLGLIAIGAGLAVFTGFASSLGESWICCHAIDAMSRNPEQKSSLSSTMIIAVALDESCGIYGLVIAILIIFILGGRA
ncbi:MAG: F0F1 ATP synthase subunit C [Bacilli bacterium]|nr:F0F1 ATP synthase subunit C [Bacilli bacterium]